MIESKLLPAVFFSALLHRTYIYHHQCKPLGDPSPCLLYNPALLFPIPSPAQLSNHFAAAAWNTSTARCHLGRPPGRTLWAASSPFWCDTNFHEMLNCFEMQQLFPAGSSCLTDPAHRVEPLPTERRQRCIQLLCQQPRT